MPARILIVEDNPTNLELMAYLLEAYGHEVDSAPDGAKGFEKAMAGDFDLILADILMPVMDGFEFVRRLKADGRNGTTPVVAVTALAMVGDRDRVLAAGFDGYIAKPIDPKSFVSAIDGYLSSNAKSDRSVHQSGTTVDVAPAEPSGRVILVVDDVPANIALVEAALKPSGHRIVRARSVAEALGAAESDVPDLIICDVHMPEAGGFELIRTVKQSQRLGAVPFIFLSSTYWHDLDKSYGISLGAAKFLTRPIDPRQLLHEVDELLIEPGDG